MTLVVAASPTPILQFFSDDGTFLVGGQLYTSVGGIPYPTYADSQGLIQHANPIILNSRGEIATSSGQSAQLYLVPGVTYTFALFDAQGNPIDTPTNIQGIPNDVTIKNLINSDYVTGLVNPLTPAEATAGITVSKFLYPTGDVRRYGAVCDGITDDSGAFQQAINVARVAGGIVRIPSPANPVLSYSIQNPLNVSIAGEPNTFGILFQGDAGSSDKPCIVFDHNGHCFDLTGANCITFKDINITTDASNFPKTCFFLARNSSGGSAGHHVFINVQVIGGFTAATLYNYGSEDDKYFGCRFENTSGTSGAAVAVISSANRYSLISTFQTIATGSQSCIDHQFFGGEFFNHTQDTAGDVFYLDAADGVKIVGPWMCCTDPTATVPLPPGSIGAGRSLIYVDGTNGASNFLFLKDIEGEVSQFLPKYGVFTSADTFTPNQWDIRSCKFPHSAFSIAISLNTTLTGSVIEHISAQPIGNNGLAFIGTLQSSTVNVQDELLTIGTSKRNSLTGDTSRWTIGARSNDFWVDTGSTNKTWTATTSGITVTGSITTNRGRYLLHGNIATINLALVASTSLSATVGQTLGGLLFPAVDSGGDFNIYDASTLQYIGSASITSGAAALNLPAITARLGIVITGSYFVA